MNRQKDFPAPEGEADPMRLPLAEYQPAFSEERRLEYRRLGLWGDRTLFDYVMEERARRPRKIAVADLEGRYTYDELIGDSEAIGKGLQRLGVRTGDIVLVVMPSVRQFVPVFLAIERLGAVVSSIMPTLGARELSDILRIARPRAVIAIGVYRSYRPAETIAVILRQQGLSKRCDLIEVGETSSGDRSLSDVSEMGSTVPDASLPAAVDADSIASLAFTTGSSGDPKGVLHTHNTALAAIRSTAVRQGLREDDVFHVGLPVGHTYGYFYGVRLGLLVGGTVVLQPSWDPLAMTELSKSYPLTVSAGTPTHLVDLLGLFEKRGKRELGNLRLFTCAGAKLDPSVARLATKALPGRLSRAYGMSETGHVASTGPDAPADKAIGTDGLPQPEISIRIDRNGEISTAEAGAGEIVAAGPFVFPGYIQGRAFGTPVLLDEGVYKTGDLGFLDSDGYLVVIGRKKDLVIRGGEKIPIGQVEAVLRQHPAVADVVIVGVPDRRLGERCVAVIEVRSGQGVSLETVRGFLDQSGVTRAFWPEMVVGVDRLPRNEVGKVRRADIEALVEAQIKEE